MWFSSSRHPWNPFTGFASPTYQGHFQRPLGYLGQWVSCQGVWCSTRIGDYWWYWSTVWHIICISAYLMIVHRSISAVPTFPGLRRFPDGHDFKQWTGDDSKALMKVGIVSYLSNCANPVLNRCISQQLLAMSHRKWSNALRHLWTSAISYAAMPLQVIRSLQSRTHLHASTITVTFLFNAVSVSTYLCHVSMPWHIILALSVFSVLPMVYAHPWRSQSI